MDRLRKAALLSLLVEELRHNRSWCGETHIQKATYLLQQHFKIPFGFEFILYHHGPFSFDLRDELTALRGDQILMLQPQLPPYGPRFEQTEFAEKIQRNFKLTIKKYSGFISATANFLNAKGVQDLEKIATAYYIDTHFSELSRKEKIGKLHEIKPHVSVVDAEKAFIELDEFKALS